MNSGRVALAVTILCGALCGCGCGACNGGDQVERLTAQLRGGCCEFTADPSDARPTNACRPTGPAQWLSDHRECVRWAADCLGELGPGASRAVPSLIDAIRSGPNNYDTGDGVIAVRDAIVEALGRTRDTRAVPVLVEALEHPKLLDVGPGASGYSSKDPVGEEAALAGLRLLGPVASPAVPRILPFLKRPVKNSQDSRIVEAAAAALGAIQDASALPALKEALGREETAIAAARALGEFGPSASAALPSLIRMIEKAPDRDGNHPIRVAIRNIGGPAAEAALPKTYEQTTTTIWKLIRAVAKKHGIRLGRIHVDGPNEEVSVEFRSGVRVHAGFDRRAWLATRVVLGNLVVRRDNVVQSSTFYQGTAQLERWLDQILPGYIE